MLPTPPASLLACSALNNALVGGQGSFNDLQSLLLLNLTIVTVGTGRGCAAGAPDVNSLAFLLTRFLWA